ncbi:MAG: hypothetical protein INR69_12490 [Mucilaginibacter polytrichastri]|nr:hypothetical protein [Mucilaginibacter polytrichastri]
MDYNDPSAGIMAGIGIFGFLVCLAITVLTIAGAWKTFEKAGKPGWAAIIPIYNIIVICEIVGKPLWWVVFLFVPCANIVVGIWLLNLLSKSFGQSEGFTVGLALLGFIFWPILGFGSQYKYLGPSAKEAQGFNNGFGNPNDPFSGIKNPFDQNKPPQDPPQL